jgi:hypothetical protein
VSVGRVRVGQPHFGSSGWQIDFEWYPVMPDLHRADSSLWMFEVGVETPSDRVVHRTDSANAQGVRRGQTSLVAGSWNFNWETHDDQVKFRIEDCVVWLDCIPTETGR